MENGGWRNHEVFKSFVESIGSLDCDDMNYTAVILIAHGVDIWPSIFPVMTKMRQCYLLVYSSLPVNIQFVERGIKENSYVSLGGRQETNRSTLAVARGKVLPEALQHGIDVFNKETSVEDIERKMCQLSGKRKTTALMQTLLKHH
eukprot:998366-Ditylum_brightwellii.AAC.1